MRIVDIPADANAGLGIFESLHGFPSAEALARHLRNTAIANYGTAACLFLERISAEQEQVRRAVSVLVRQFVEEHVPAGADGQVLRVASRFALIAAAGELAVAAGVITPWEEGEATSAARKCFEDWLAERGGVEPSEVRDGIDQVRSFLLTHGEARFVPAWEIGHEGRLPLRDIAGYRKQTDGAWDYYVTAAAWRDEVCRGFDSKALASAMVARGMLGTGDEIHRAKSVKVPGVGQRRLYHVVARFLEGEQ